MVEIRAKYSARVKVMCRIFIVSLMVQKCPKYMPPLDRPKRQRFMQQGYDQVRLWFA